MAGRQIGRLGGARRRATGRIAELESRLAEQAALIEAQSQSLAHTQKIFDRSSAAARIGVWQCNLPDETLHWTDVVYDIFDLPRGSALERNEIVKFYAPGSVEELRLRRSRAIAERTGFELDAEIVTVKGNRRWIRITASVECENGDAVRIFGMKQDITEEKILADQTRYLASFDVLTGLANRARFQARLTEGPEGVPPIGALLLVDLDGFKQINDTFGHVVGDDCLRQAAERLKTACADVELVSRIGGDEFAVLTGVHLGLAGVSELARTVIEKLDAPVEHQGRTLRVGASVGIALAEDCAPQDLLPRADTALYQAKAGGRSTFRIYKPDGLACLPNPRAA